MMETRNIGGRLVAVLHSRPTGRGSITRARVEGISVELGCDSFEIVNLYAAELPTSRLWIQSRSPWRGQRDDVRSNRRCARQTLSLSWRCGVMLGGDGRDQSCDVGELD